MQYSTFGHVQLLAEAEKRGIEAAGGQADIFQYARLQPYYRCRPLPPDLLLTAYAAAGLPKPSHKISSIYSMLPQNLHTQLSTQSS